MQPFCAFQCYNEMSQKKTLRKTNARLTREYFTFGDFNISLFQGADEADETKYKHKLNEHHRELFQTSQTDKYDKTSQ